MIRAVAFDLDGTLADTLEDIADALNHVLAQHGLPALGYERYPELIGEGARRLVAKAIAAGDAEAPDPAHAPEDPRVDAVHRAFLAHYGLNLRIKTQAYPGVRELLEGLAAEGVPIAVLSNKPDAATQALVARLFAGIPFRAVRGQQPGGPRKPDPAVARALAPSLGVDGDAVALVGDSPLDVQTALSAGWTPIGVAWGFRPAAELRQAGARLILDRPEALWPHVRSPRRDR